MNWSIIVAVSENGVIGNCGKLPWRLPADLRFFKDFTRGKTVLMGRKTWFSIGRPLPERRNVVLSRDLHLKCEGAEVFSNLDQFASSCRSNEMIVVIGGSEIYQQALTQNRVSELRLTIVHANVEGDAFFAPPQSDEWLLTESIFRGNDERNAFDLSFQTYLKKNP